MSARKPTRPGSRRRTPRRPRTAAPVRAAAARAVDRVLSSPDAFSLLIHRLEGEGWRIERAPLPLPSGVEPAELVTPGRAR
jgi:hypothetical protein